MKTKTTVKQSIKKQLENKGLYARKFEELWKNANRENVFDSQDGGLIEQKYTENKRNNSITGRVIHKERVCLKFASKEGI